ncbi:hypothetical protein [Streptomyces sp. NPDC003077]|uniref:hypothetical protein n=1 Tax=Streptomyces sp. NPDC003077 TaxID=3154443 RepID=UPI0033B5281A
MTAPSVSQPRAAADLRLLRAAVFTAVCVVLSAAGHIAGSCAGVPLWTLGVGCAAVFAVAAPLAGRERTLPGIAATLAVGQVALHALFSLGQHAAPRPQGTAGTSDDAMIALARHLTCGLSAGQLDGAEARRVLESAGHVTSVIDPALFHVKPSDPAMFHVEPSTMHGLLPSLPMLLGHLLAALAAGWLLRRGEAALWRLVRLSAPAARAVTALVGALRGALALLRVLLAGLVGALDGTPRAPFPYGHEQARPQELLLQHSVVRRGPPSLALAA